jgi:hypothetical protein
MNFPVVVEALNGNFIASLPGVPELSVEEPTRAQAIESLRAEIRQRVEQGELLLLEVDPIGVSSLAGKYSNDPTLREICEQAYQMRDAETRP